MNGKDEDHEMEIALMNINYCVVITEFINWLLDIIWLITLFWWRKFRKSVYVNMLRHLNRSKKSFLSFVFFCLLEFEFYKTMVQYHWLSYDSEQMCQLLPHDVFKRIRKKSLPSTRLEVTGHPKIACVIIRIILSIINRLWLPMSGL